MAIPSPEMSCGQSTPSAFQQAGEVLPSHVSPWAVEHLPNPVMFSALFAVHAGYNVVRTTLETKEQDSAGSHSLGNTGNGSVVDMPSLKCVDCDQVFRTRGLLT
jgi:hypothetical protein